MIIPTVNNSISNNILAYSTIYHICNEETQN